MRGLSRLIARLRGHARTPDASPPAPHPDDEFPVPEAAATPAPAAGTGTGTETHTAQPAFVGIDAVHPDDWLVVFPQEPAPAAAVTDAARAVSAAADAASSRGADDEQVVEEFVAASDAGSAAVGAVEPTARPRRGHDDGGEAECRGCRRSGRWRRPVVGLGWSSCAAARGKRGGVVSAAGR